MRACTIKDVKKFEIKEIEEPKEEEGKILIDVKLTGICGSDIHNWVNGEPKGLVMGHEFCGTVASSGNKSDLKVGDRVTALPISPCGVCEACKKGNVGYCPDTWTNAIGLSLSNPGGLTSKIAVREDMVIKVPDNLRDEEVAMVEPLAVGLHATHLANIAVGEKVLVIGGGIIGLVSAVFSKMEGASEVVLIETNSKRGENAVSLEVVDEWYDATKEDTVAKLLEKTNGGFDVVLECVGNGPAVNSAITMVKPGGKVILVGVATEAVATYTVLAVMKEVMLQGAIAYNYDEFKTCIDLMSEKKINVMKFVSDIVPLEKCEEAYERLTSGTDSAVKILVNPNE